MKKYFFWTIGSAIGIVAIVFLMLFSEPIITNIVANHQIESCVDTLEKKISSKEPSSLNICDGVYWLNSGNYGSAYHVDDEKTESNFGTIQTGSSYFCTKINFLNFCDWEYDVYKVVGDKYILVKYKRLDLNPYEFLYIFEGYKIKEIIDRP